METARLPPMNTNTVNNNNNNNRTMNAIEHEPSNINNNPSVRQSPSIGQFFKNIRTRSKSPSVNKQNAANVAGLVPTYETTPVLGRRALPVHTNNGNNTQGHTPAPAPTTPLSHSPSRIKKWLRSSSKDMDDTHVHSTSTTKHNASNTSAASEQATDCVNANTPNNHNSFGSFVARLSSRWRHAPIGVLSKQQKPLVAQLDPRETQSEEDLVSKSLASEIVSSLECSKYTANNNMPLAPSNLLASGNAPFYSQELDTGAAGAETTRQPSYVRVSCALSGYRNYRSQSNLNSITPRSARTIDSLTTRPNFYGNLYADKSPSAANHNKQDTPLSAGRTYVERRRGKFEQTECGSSSTAHALVNGNQTMASELADCAAAGHVKDRVVSFDMDNAQSTGKRPTSINIQNAHVNDNSQSHNRAVSRPSTKPPPAPPPRTSSVKKNPSFSPTNSSSAPTDTCITGPLTPPEDGNSLLEDVLKAGGSIWSDSGSNSASAQCSQTQAISVSAVTPCVPNQSNMATDGHFYQQCAHNTRVLLTTKCTAAEQALETQQVSEEAADFIRLAVGKARLLMRKKLAKFDELVEKNLNPIEGDPCPALVDDLTGYYDLLQIDLADVNACFDAVDIYRRNQWRQLPPGMQPVITSAFSNGDVADSSANNSSSSASINGNAKNARSHTPSPSRFNAKNIKDPAAKQRDEDRRRRLMQAKLQAKQRHQHDNGDTQIFVTTPSQRKCEYFRQPEYINMTP